MTGRLFGFVLAAIVLIVGMAYYSTYTGLTSSLEQVSGQLSGTGKTLVEIGALFASVMSGALSADASESQQIFVGLTYLLTWLVLIWLLRHLSSGAQVRVRDGLYNAAAPMVSTAVIVAVGVLQLLPLALLTVVLAALTTSGFGGTALVIVSLLLIVAAFTATLYWISGTMFAAVVATIPGTYPLTALRSTKRLVSGHRAEVVKRIVWLGVLVIAANLVAVLPAVLLDALLGYALPLVVVSVVMCVQVATAMYATAYVYFLYRGVIDERAD